MEACCGAHHLGRMLECAGISPADVAGIRASVRQSAEERRPGCRGDRRGGDAPDDALRRAQEPRSSSTCKPSTVPRPAGGRAHGLDQPVACHPAGTRGRRRDRVCSSSKQRVASCPGRGGLSSRPRFADSSRTCWNNGVPWKIGSRLRPGVRGSGAHDEVTRRLTTIPGVGPMNATALMAAVGNARASPGRDLAAWLGLVPRQATTGGKPRLLGITKRGNKYLRKLLLQGARSVMPKLARSDTWLGAWLRGLRRARTRMPLSWRSATSWRGSRGRSCARRRFELRQAMRG